MDLNHRNSEKGQAIVYLVLGLVVFLGFVALAIDGGMAMSNRRHGQNAADASTLAGAAAAGLEYKNYQGYTCKQQWSCNVVPSAFPQAYRKAIDRAEANGFTIKHHDESPNHNYVELSCGGSTWYDGYIDVTVDITATSPSNFLQLVYPDALKYSVQSVSRMQPGGPLMYGNAIVALNPASCTGQLGVSFHGTGDINVQGGGIFSNGCVRADGAAVVSVVPDPNDPTTIPNIKIDGNDLKYDPTKDALDPPPNDVTYQIPGYAYDVKPPVCPTDPSGWYTDNNLPNNLSGLYCISGDLTFKHGPYVGTDVTIYIPDGKLTINGNEEVTLSAPAGNSHPDAAIPGILFYLPTTNHNPVKLNGTSQVTITGVVFAPGSAITLTGTDDVTSFSSTQFIGWDVEVGGTQQTNIVYNGCDGFIFPPSIELNK